MNRRGFLSSLTALAGIATFDLERALWVPSKLISIPASNGPIRFDIYRTVDDYARHLGYRAGLTVDTLIRQEFDWEPGPVLTPQLLRYSI